MFRISQASSITGPRVRKPLVIALSAALLSLVSLGISAAPAQAADDPLLVGVSCPDQNTTFRDAYVQGQGWVPGWTYIERQRRAYVCLFNAVRAKVASPKLSACSQDATYCDIGAVAVYTRQQVANLTTAGQWKSMEVDYMCATATGGNPHYACGRAANYWLNWWRDNNPGVSYTAWGEILNVGYPHLNTPRAVVNDWLSEPFDSTGHRRHREIILDGNYHYVGVGVTPAWYGDIAAGAPYYWGTFRQVISADFIN